VATLLAHGANPNAPITRGTPVRRNSEDFELPATLIGATPYVLAAKFLEVDIMRALLAGGADPHVKMKDGTTALMAAAGLGAVGRADRQADRRGLSVVDGGKLEDASRVLEAVTVVLSAGGDVNAVNQAGETALFSAAALGYDRVIQLLADNGAQLNVRNNRGQTPLAAIDRPGEHAPSSTVDLLRRLGGVK
jgi:uncharacterized protein